ncbi:MAG: rhomboid family intramembrane serine protease [Flavobacteriales bacterium]
MLLIILVGTIIISLWANNNIELKERMLFIPYRIKHQQEYGRFITHGFIHADFPHLAFNMMTLFFMGEYLYGEWMNVYGNNGAIYFCVLYFSGMIAATLFPMIKHQDQQEYRSLGASGAVSAVLFAVILWNPTLSLSLMFIPIPIPAYIFGPIYLLFEYYSLKKGNTGIAHDAHIGGAIFGLLFVLMLDPQKAIQFVHLFH